MKTISLIAIVALTPFALSTAAPLVAELVAPVSEVVVPRDSLAAASRAGEVMKELKKKDEAQLAVPDDAIVPPSKNQSPEEAAKERQELESQIENARALKQGVNLRLRLTNPGKKPLSVHYGPDTSTNHLTVSGPRAIKLPYRGAVTMEFRTPEPIVIGPGEFMEVDIKELHHGMRDLDRWMIGQEGTYVITLRFVTTIGEEKVDITTKPVKIQVKAG